MAYQSAYDGKSIDAALKVIIDHQVVKKVCAKTPDEQNGNVDLSIENLNWNDQISGILPVTWLKNKIEFDDSVEDILSTKNYITASGAPVQSVNGDTGAVRINTGVLKIQKNSTILEPSDGVCNIGDIVTEIILGGESVSGSVTITPDNIGAISKENNLSDWGPKDVPQMAGNEASKGADPTGKEHFARQDHVHPHDTSKVDKTQYADGTTYGLSLYDFNKAAHDKLDGIAEGAQPNYRYIANQNKVKIDDTHNYGEVYTTSTVTSTENHIPCPIINGVPYYGDASKGIKIDEYTCPRDEQLYTILPAATEEQGGWVKFGENIDTEGDDGIGASQANLKLLNSNLNSLDTKVTNLTYSYDTSKSEFIVKQSHLVTSCEDNGKALYVTGVTNANSETYYNTNIKIVNSVLLGGAWNDYAESRNSVEDPSWLIGRCVKEIGNGQVSATTNYLECCAGIVSDTYGMLIGTDYENKCPIAVAGRVLVYPETQPEDFEIDDVVCTAPDGCVRKMTREEVKEWPDRIVGIVSEIPQYEKWNDVEVNGRIWIKVK